MSNVIAQLVTFLNPIGMTIILVYCFGIFSRAFPSPLRISITMGFLLGLAAWVAMAAPIQLDDGVIVDLRALFVGISAAFFGWRAALITTVMAVGFRIEIGGIGMFTGIFGIVIAAIAGLFWRRKVEARIKSSILSLIALSSLISVNMVSAFMLPHDGPVVFFQTMAPLVFALNFFGTVIFTLLITREMTMLGKENSLLKAASTDPLTKILNRRSVIDKYGEIHDQAIFRRGVAMVCIDVDHFKAINDTFGHLPGDQVLVEISRRISSCLRPTDLFARMSGDEFLVVLTNVSSDEALDIADRCRKIISRAPIATNGMHI
ncbi:MAG: diguanylate cyclase [Yoonia sp.]